MDQGLLGVWLVLAETLKNDSIGTFREHLDLPIWTPYNGRHALACRIEFTNVQYFVFQRLAVDVHENGLRLAGLPRYIRTVRDSQTEH